MGNAELHELLEMEDIADSLEAWAEVAAIRGHLGEKDDLIKAAEMIRKLALKHMRDFDLIQTRGGGFGDCQ